MAAFGAAYLGGVVLLMLAEPWLGLPSPRTIDLANVFDGPSVAHPLGTDENGRDVFVRMIHGGRVSLLVGLVTAVLTVVVGALVGAVAGFFGGAVDATLMRFTDGMMSIPVFFVVLAVVALWGASMAVMISVLALTRWMSVARLVRAEVLRTKSLEFVTAAHGLGASSSRVLLVHLLPQATPSIIVATSIGIGTVMLVEAALSFLGLGIQPPTPSWGNMLGNSQLYIWSAPWLAVYPGVAILLTVLAFNSLGDALRDALDPRMRSAPVGRTSA